MMNSIVLEIDGIIWWLVLALTIIAICLISFTQNNIKRKASNKNIKSKNTSSNTLQSSQMYSRGKMDDKSKDGKPKITIGGMNSNLSENSDVSEYWIGKKAFITHEIEVMEKITLIGNSAVKMAQTDSNEALLNPKLRQWRKPI